MRSEKELIDEIKELGAQNTAVFGALENKTIFISGATGLIGSTIIKAIATNVPSAKIVAFVRDENKAKKMFQNYEQNILFVTGDIREPIVFDGHVDYVIHAASETSSKAFVEAPVSIIEIALNGTKNMLDFARQKNVQGFVYLSSMEIYGTPPNDDKIFESHGTDLDTMNVRSSYSEGKRLCETLCTAYASQFQVPAKVIRLTQTFGPGVQYNDGRVFADFSRCAIENRDIILHTKGETKRSYLYTLDAVSAILTVLTKGKNAEAYNAANEDTYCSIYEMAQLVAQKIAQGKIQVKVEETDISSFGYAKTLHMNLDTSKLKALGWKPQTNLGEMFSKTIQSMKA
ncbi:MAG: NAD(P)-dependent oxidoreductase [Fibrobacter sp.]|nr:NAD(P)-dependent oxidoreductase [Fibrobacter sp.]